MASSNSLIRGAQTKGMTNVTLCAWVAGAAVTLTLLLLPRKATNLVRRWGAIAIIIAVGAIGWTAASRDVIDMDEVQHLHASWLITQGHQPFADFFEHHTPLYWRTAGRLVHAIEPHPTVRIFFAARIVTLATVLATLVALIWLAYELRTGATLALSALLVSGWMNPAFEFRPDGLAMLFSVLAVGALARAIRRQRWTWAAASGVCLAIATGLVVKVWPIMAIWLLAVGWLAVSRQWRLTIAALAGALAGGLAVLADAVWVADLSDMWTCIVQTNAARHAVVLATEKLSWQGYPKYLALQCPLAVVAGLAAVVLLLWKRGRPDGWLVAATCGFAVAIAAFVVQQRPNPHYLLMPILATAILLAAIDGALAKHHATPVMHWISKILLALAVGIAVQRTLPYAQGMTAPPAGLKAWYQQLEGKDLFVGFLRMNRPARRAAYDSAMAKLLRYVSPGQKVIASIGLHPIWAVDAQGWFCPPVMRRSGAEVGLWPKAAPEFAKWLTEDPPDVIVAPMPTKSNPALQRPTGGWLDEVMLTRPFVQWMVRHYKPIDTIRYRWGLYGVFTPNPTDPPPGLN